MKKGNGIFLTTLLAVVCIGLAVVCFMQHIEISNLRTVSDSTNQYGELKLTLEMSSIDYGGLASWALSVGGDDIILDGSTEAGIVYKLQNASAAVAETILDILPQKSKNLVAAYLINANRENFVLMMEEYARNNGFSLRIDSWTAEVK